MPKSNRQSRQFWVGFLLAAGLVLANTSGLRAFDHQIAESMVQNPLPPASPSVESSVLQVAKQVTVRILKNQGAGSGVIIDRQGGTYTVLTCDHVVVSESQDQTYQILTPDGKTHWGRRRPMSGLQGLDLAVVEFTSSNPYQVAVLGNYEDISIGKPIYVAGFPNYQPRDDGGLHITHDWGLRAFRFTTGNLSMRLSGRTLQRGYQLAYTNATIEGMSGGPVLNDDGELIGIHGRGRVTIHGIETFRFSDGTLPSPELYEYMSPFSWAVPISAFQRTLEPRSTRRPFSIDPTPPSSPATPMHRNPRPEKI